MSNGLSEADSQQLSGAKGGQRTQAADANRLTGPKVTPRDSALALALPADGLGPDPAADP